MGTDTRRRKSGTSFEKAKKAADRFVMKVLIVLVAAVVVVAVVAIVMRGP